LLQVHDVEGPPTAVQYFEDAEWWAANGEAVNKKWEAFKLSL